MNTFEDELRAELHDALSTAGPDLPTIDTGQAVHAGHAALRRRRLVATGGVAAAAALVVVAGSLLNGANRVADVRPGGSPSASVPAAETSSVRIELDGPKVPGGMEATEFVVKIGPNAMPTLPDMPRSEADLAYYAVVDGTEQLMGGSSTPEPGGATLGFGGQDVVIGVVPSDAVAVALIDTASVSGYSTSQVVPVPGTAFSAVAFRLDAIPSGTPDLAPMWWRQDGTPVTNSGSGTVVRFQTPDGPHDLWALPAGDLYGVRGPTGSRTSLLSSLFADGVADIDATGGYVEDKTTSPSTLRGDLVHVYVIKGKATKVAGTYAAQVTGPAEIESTYSPELDATVVLARAMLPPTAGLDDTRLPLLTRLTWTDAAGTAQAADF